MGWIKSLMSLDKLVPCLGIERKKAALVWATPLECDVAYR